MRPSDILEVVCDMQAKHGRAALSILQATVYDIVNTQCEIEMGGMLGFLVNSSGNDFSGIIISLVRIGATNEAKILEAAQELFPGGIIPASREKRQECLNALSDETLEKLSAIRVCRLQRLLWRQA